MSLLLDALRRAEEARRAKEAENKPAQPASVALDSDPEPTTTPLAFPPLELSLDEEQLPLPPGDTPAVDERQELRPFNAYEGGLALEATPTPIVALQVPRDIPAVYAPASLDTASSARPVAPQQASTQEMARNVFAVKQPNFAKPLDEAKSRNWLLPAVAVIVVLLGTGGWYVWNEINKMSGASLARVPVPPVALPRAAANTGQVDSKPGTTAAFSAAVEELPQPPMLPPPAVLPPAPRLPAKLASVRTLTARESIAQKLKDAPASPAEAVGLKLARSFEPARLNPDLAAAYQSLASGDYVTAAQQYRLLAAAEPLNVDAQLGLATAAARGGDKSQATLAYRRVLALDPRNGFAIMGLVALNDGVQPASLEIELKTLIGRNPEAAPLHFALGNLYSSGLRWTEAQQAYFEAFRLDALNADYVFNLAVSLDQLKQARLALDYYRKAESIMLNGGTGQFDRRSVATRIRELSESARIN